MHDCSPPVDPDGLLEYSVVYTDHALNHMSARFKRVLNDVSVLLKQTYNAHSAIIVPGGGTFGMEAVARQFASSQHCLVIRNGGFSYRWSRIFEMGAIVASHTVCKARRSVDAAQAPFAPPAAEDVAQTIREQRPAVVFAPHVETSAGIVLPNDYLRTIAAAAHEVDGLFVLDCIASGVDWVDMQACGVDVLLSAPQKGWSASPCCAMVMLGREARERIEATTSTSFACDLRQWLQIMETYEAGGQAYHATMPTDGLVRLRHMMFENRAFGFETARAYQHELGARIRTALEQRGYASVADDGFKASGVVVSYTSDPRIQSGKKFAEAGVQVAAGVPLMCDEGDDYRAFRVGLFGLDKLRHVERTVERFSQALDRIA